MGNSSSSSPNQDKNNKCLLAPPQNGNTSKNASSFSLFFVEEQTKPFLISGYSDGTLALYELNSAPTVSPRASIKISQSEIVSIDQMIVQSSTTNIQNSTNFFFVCLSRQPPQLIFVKLEMKTSANNSCCNYFFSTIPSSHVSLFSLCEGNNFTNSTRFSSCMNVVSQKSGDDASAVSVVVGGDDGSVCCVGQEEENFCPTVKMFSDAVVGILPLQFSASSHCITFVGVAKNSEKVVVFDFVDRSYPNGEEQQEEGTARKKISSEISVRQELQVPGMTDVIGIFLMLPNERESSKVLMIISSHELFVINVRSENSLIMQITSRIPLVARKNEIVTSCYCSSFSEKNAVFVVTNEGALLKISLENTLKIENYSQNRRIPSSCVSSIRQLDKNLFFFIETGSGFVSSFKMDDIDTNGCNNSTNIQTAKLNSDGDLSNSTSIRDRNLKVNRHAVKVDKNAEDLSIQHSFDFFDFDGSGFLEKTEALAAFAHLMQKNKNSSPTRRARAAREIFDASDWNQDGKISFAEFKKAVLNIF